MSCLKDKVRILDFITDSIGSVKGLLDDSGTDILCRLMKDLCIPLDCKLKKKRSRETPWADGRRPKWEKMVT